MTSVNVGVCLRCQQLRPLTVVQQRIEGNHEAAPLDSFLR